MATLRRVPVFALVTGALVVAGCSSGTPSPTLTPSSSAVTSPPAATDGITTAVDLARVMGDGAEALQYAQIDLNGGGTESVDVDGDGVATFAGGRLTALEISGPAASGAGELRVRIVGGTAYTRTYDLDGGATGLWQRVTATNAATTDVRGAVAALAAVADPGPLAAALGTAGSFEEVGTVGYGIRYSMSDFAAGTALSAALGADVRPTDAFVDLDPAGRPRLANVRITVDGRLFAVRVSLSDFDTPVTVETPPAGEIAD